MLHRSGIPELNSYQPVILPFINTASLSNDGWNSFVGDPKTILCLIFAQNRASIPQNKQAQIWKYFMLPLHIHRCKQFMSLEIIFGSGQYFNFK